MCSAICFGLRSALVSPLAHPHTSSRSHWHKLWAAATTGLHWLALGVFSTILLSITYPFPCGPP
jgi:hypothetical protein